MPTPVLPPPLVEQRDDERAAFRLINALRQLFLTTRVSRVISGASGDITVGAVNGNAIEFVDADGTSLGVVALSAFTVNP